MTATDSYSDRLSYRVVTIEVGDLITILRSNIYDHPLFRQYLLEDIDMVGYLLKNILNMLVLYLPYVDIDTVISVVSSEMSNKTYQGLAEDKMFVTGIIYQILMDNTNTIKMIVDRLMSSIDNNSQCNYRLLRYHHDTIILLGSDFF